MGLKEDLQHETVSRLPIREAIAVPPATTIREAVEKMRAQGLGCAVIVDAEGKPEGIFTERALLGVLLEGVSLDDTSVGQHIYANYSHVKSSEPISRVWDEILHGGYRFVCVTDDDGKLVGLTGQRGLSEYISEYFPQQVMVQRLGGKPWIQDREGA